jgi:CO/xanthine dehydrogenase FAD-binding subunit
MTSSYLAAATVEEVVEAMAAGARPVAGGTDLVVGARQGKAPLPESIVAIHGVESLRGIRVVDGTLRLGALVTHAELAAHPVVRERLTALADAAARVGSHATRAHGTLGGNLMNASPAMETGGPLAVFGASVTLRSRRGERSLPVAELFAGPGRTTAEPGELLTAVEVPLPPEGSGSAYARLEYRRHMEIAVVGASAAVTLAGDAVESAAVAITALAPTVRVVPEAGDALASGGSGAAARAAAAAAEPISDVRASEEYRRAMTEVLTRRVVEAALARARGEAVPIPASETLFGLGGAA